MSGHSKWATIKHKKGAADKARGKLFAKIARQIEVAAREGGGDVNSNATLRTVIQKAKAGQMTNDAIDRAVKRGSGEAQGENYESITYEGYAPGGVAMLVDTLTNNRNRTGADVRNIFSKLGRASMVQSARTRNLVLVLIFWMSIVSLSVSTWSSAKRRCAGPFIQILEKQRNNSWKRTT
jgi:YebC/PmpR family DNA-binding regulatory protein